jgi:hypothetical protein
MAKTKRIHINQHNIKTNRALGTHLPVITVKTYNANDKYNRLRIDSDPPVDIVYSPDKPLSCGARVWIETKAEVTGDKL